MSSDDARQVEALLDGAPGAWGAFVARYAPYAAAVVRQVLLARGVRPDPTDVDDVCENLFLMLLDQDARLLRRYDPAHALTAYLGVLARTAAHRWLRKRRPGASLPEDTRVEAFPDPEQRTASEETATREVLGAVREELAALGEREQRVLRLFYFEGQDYQAIAAALGISVNSVGAALTRARARLARALGERADLTESDFQGVVGG